MSGEQTPRSAAKRILIIEDNELNLKLLHDVLAVSGYEVLSAQRGDLGLDLARREQPDLILLDLQLPDISGLDVARQLKGQNDTRAIPVIAVTAFALLGDDTKALESGCDGYVAKPIDLRDFLAVVEKFASPSTSSTKARTLGGAGRQQ